MISLIEGVSEMGPLKLIAPCKDYLWGGTKLKTEYHQQSSEPKLAESWMLSCHKDGLSVIAEGEYAGLTLKEYIDRAGRAVLGSDCNQFEQFPILVKLIDAQNRLSVQVHPDNAYALKKEGEYGKTEMWYVVENEPGASLYYGFKKTITKDEFKDRIANNTLLEVLNEVKVHPGDVFFIGSGTLHAIGAGIVIAEIQQNSNTTYRIYDYARVGKDGQQRELHIEKALDVTKLEKPQRSAKPQGVTEHLDGYSRTLLASCDYFTVYRMELEEGADWIADSTSFHSILCLSGEADLLRGGAKLLSLHKGDSVFVPAGCGNYTVKGKCEALFTKV
jgi:mannose-6-phosphate isomerase